MFVITEFDDCHIFLESFNTKILCHIQTSVKKSVIDHTKQIFNADKYLISGLFSMELHTPIIDKVLILLNQYLTDIFL